MGHQPSLVNWAGDRPYGAGTGFPVVQLLLQSKSGPTGLTIALGVY